MIGNIKEIGAEDRISVDINGDNQEVWPKTAAWFLGPKVYLIDFFRIATKNLKIFTLRRKTMTCSKNLSTWP